MQILGIESSCDETAAAIYCTDQGLLAHQIYSQIALHDAYGGVVPELASRDHVRKLMPLVRAALAEAQLEIGELDGIAYTAGPGLAGALLVGAVGARSLAFGAGLPALAINHLEGHILAPLLEPVAPAFPYLCLLVSGGHTEIVAVHALGRYELLGGTLDDAAGEAFDKTAKLLGLGYPGGAALAQLATQGDPEAFKFPRPMMGRPGLEMSFSGLKTAAITQYRKVDAARAPDIAASFQAAVVDTLALKVKRAIKQSGLKRIVVAGGVGANTALRASLARLAAGIGGECFYPRPEFCTDNAAMIALAGALRMAEGESSSGLSASIKPRWPLDQLRPPA